MNVSKVLIGAASAVIVVGGFASSPASARTPRLTDGEMTAIGGTDPGPVRPETEAVELEVFPTGTGPADEEVCTGFQSLLEANVSSLKTAMKEGDGASAEQFADAIDNVENMAFDAGCAILY